MLLKKMTALVTALAFVSPGYSMSMQEVFDSVNAEGNVTNPAVLQGQTMNLYTGGSLFMRMPKRTYQLATITPPSWNTGCGGDRPFCGRIFVHQQGTVCGHAAQYWIECAGLRFQAGDTEPLPHV